MSELLNMSSSTRADLTGLLSPLVPGSLSRGRGLHRQGADREEDCVTEDE